MKSFTNISACNESAGAISLAVAAPVCGRAAPGPGHGVLGVIRSGGRSVVHQAYATSPLRLLMPANHGHAAWVYTSSFGGGLVDGDRIVMDVEVGPDAAAFLSTQASTKIYRSPRGTSAETTARIGPGGLLVVAPDPVVCFARSRYRQTQRFDVADDAGLVLVDWICSGRLAAGERWAFEEYVGRIVVRVGGALLVHDGLALRAADGDLAGRLGRFEVLAVLVLAGMALRREAASIVASANAAKLARRADLLVGATSLGDRGCVLRIAGVSVEQVGREIRKLLEFVPAMLGDDPWQRKW